MEQEVARWLFTQLGYNAAADATLSSNCRGNLRGLWEFVIANYKTADSKRHIQHVLERHRRERETALKAPEQQREAEARRQRLHQLRKKIADLEAKARSLQSRTEGKAQEAVDQACEQSLMQHVLQETHAQTLLLQAHVHRGQQLLPELQARLAQLRYTLDTIKARSRHTGSSKAQQALQQQLAALSASVKQGLNQALWESVDPRGIRQPGCDLHNQLDQHPAGGGVADQELQVTGVTSSGTLVHSGGMQSHQQQPGEASSAAEGLQQLLRVCQLLRSYKVHPDVLASALQLLQSPPALLWDTCTQLARANLAELTARLDEAEREMLAPLHWPGSASAALQHKPDQQQLVAYGGGGSSGGSSGSSSGGRHRLPWSSGMTLPPAAALQELGISPPPEVRIKLRMQHHLDLHVQTQQTLQRVQAAQREYDSLIGGSPLLMSALAAAAGPGAGEGPWEAQLAQLYLQRASLRAQMLRLQQYEQRFGDELLQLQDIRAVTQDKDADMKQQMDEDGELNQLLHLATQDNMELEQALKQQQHMVAELLALQLVPCGSAAAEAAQAAAGKAWAEAEAVEKLPVLQLTEQTRVSSSAHDPTDGSKGSSQSNPVLRRSTLSRLQSAGQQLLLAGRATTGAMRLKGTAVGAGGQDVLAFAGGADSSRRFGDSAAVAALKGAALLDPVAPLRCPAALLLDVAGQCKEARELQQQLAGLSSISAALASSITAAVDQEGSLLSKVDELHAHERGAVLLQLQALLEEGQAAHALAQGQILTDLQQQWEMPAMHLVPHRTYQGKNCSDWLLELQRLHLQKQELARSTGHAHMA